MKHSVYGHERQGHIVPDQCRIGLSSSSYTVIDQNPISVNGGKSPTPNRN